uniref:retention module-containing protein n=1 Tax=Alcaligenes faecalis TaxID=511 RepID=UPI003D0651CE
MALDTVLVTQVQGTAWIRTSDGAKVAVQEGMRVPVNAEIVTETGASVELQIPGSPPMTISDNREFLVSGDIAETDADAVAAALANPDDPAITAVLAALESGQDPFAQLDPTAAVLTGGGEGGGSSFTRLVSIVETTRPLALEYPRPDVPTIENVRLGGYSGGDEDPTLVTGTTVITLETPDHITEGDPYEIIARVGQPVTGRDLIISLTNGSTITIPVGSTEGRVTVENPYPDDVYQQGDRPETVGITGTEGGNYESLDTSSTTTTTVQDDSDKTTITLESPTDVVEGKEYEIVARVDHPVTGEDLVIKLDNGHTITIPVGGSEGKVTIAPRDDDAYQQGDESVTVGITGTEGGNYESLDTSSTTTTTVKDDSDKTTITLESPTDVVEGKEYEIVARVDHPVTGEDLVIKLDNGHTITIPVGGSEGKVTITPRDDDAYQQGDEPVTVGITGTEGGNYESLDTSSTTTTTVKDDSDKTTITLESPTDVVEGKEYEIVARVDHPVTGEDLVIKLDNGHTITIPVGGSEGKVTITPRDDDAYQQGDEPVTVGITGTEGGNYESLDTSSTTTTTVKDDSDKTTITLESPTDVVEGKEYEIVARVDHPVTGEDLVIKLDNGHTITIPVGGSEGKVTITPRDDDAYQQGDEPVTVGITGTEGGNYESLDTSSTTTTTVKDDSDKTTITLESPTDVVEGKEYEIVARVDHPVTGADLVIKLDNGHTITIPVGGSEGKVTITPRDDDAYQQGDEPVTVGITGTEGGNYESLDTSSTTTTTIKDDVDTVTVTIESNGNVTEAEDAVFTVRVDTVLADDLVVTLKNGDKVTIEAGKQTAEYKVPAQGDDVYKDAGEVTVGIDTAFVEGKAFENLTLGDPATAKVVDTVDVVTATLTANTDSVAEGGEITYTITLSNEKGAPMDQHGELTFTLANGETITIKAGETTGSVTTPVADDAFVGGQPAIENSIVGAPTMAGGVAFEKLETAGTPTVAVTDEPGTPGGPVDPENPGNQGDAITISIKADKAEFAEDEAQTFTVSIDKPVGRDVVVTLDGGQTVTIKANEQTVTYTRPAQGDDVYQDGADLSVALEGAKAADGAAFENLTLGDPATAKVVDTVDVVTATLTANTDSVAEGGEITYTITLSNEKGAPMDQHGELTFTLANGETITIKAGETTGSVTTPVADDAFVGGQPAIENSIVGAPTMAGGVAFEKLETAGTPTVAVTDEPGTPGGPVDPENPGNQGDAITISIKADKAEFAEDEAQTFTVSIDKPVGRDVVVTLDGGQTVTIKANEQTVTYTRPAQGDDVYQDGADLSVALEGAKAADGAAFENLTLGDPATAKVVDTVDVVTATLTANTDSVAEGGEITYTITLSNEKGAPMDQHGELTFTLANGETITIKAGETTGSVTTPVADDAFVGGQPAIENSIVGAPTMAGGVAFEKLETAGTPTVAVTDEPGTPGGPVDPENPGNQGDAITISIKADKAEFAEDEAQTFTVSIDKPVGRDVVVTLDGGQTVTIKANEQTVTYTRPAQGDDVYQDGADLSVALEGAKAADGAAFENLTLGDPATAKVVDTVDVVTATLTANTDSVAEGGEITYTITLSNEKGAPMDQHGELTFTLANGETITIKAGETTGSVTTPVADDAFVGGQPAIENSIVGAPTMAGGVAFEKLETAGTPTVAVTDEPGTPGGPVDPENPGNQGDAITISIKADKAEFAEDEAQTFTVSIDKPVGRDVVVTLDGGQTVTIKANEQTVTYTRPAQGDDVYQDGADLSVALEGAKAADGAAFENLTLGDPATAKVVDTVDVVTATLTANTDSVAEGGEITYTITLSNEKGAPMDQHGELTFTLANGETITIKAGETTGSVTTPVADDAFVGGQPAIENSIVGAPTMAGGVAFEKLETAGTPTVAVTDEPGTPGGPVDPENPGNQGDAITISIKADKAEFAEDEAQTFTVSIDKPVGRDVVVTLDGGQTVTIKANEQTVTYTRPAQGDDVYQDGADLSVALEGAKAADGAAFENLTLGDPATAKVVDTVDVVTATLTANTDSVAEGGEITYTITLSNEKGAPMDQHGELTFTLANGETITIKAGETTGSVTTPVADDAFVGGQPAIENSIVGAPTMAGGVAFEKLETAGTPTVAVTDEPGTPGGPVDPENPGNQGDAITISIKADKAEFAEDEAQTFTVSIDKPVGRDVVVTLDGGQTVTIKANEQTVTYTRPAQGDDVYQDGADLSVALEGAKAADGAAFENLTLGDPATAKVVDTVDVVTATLTANTDSVAEGGEITYTITLSNEKGAPMDQHGELTFTLANGETITIKAGETTGSVTTPVADDAFVGGQPAIENSIVGAPTMAGGVAFEKLETAGTPTVAVTDEPGTPGGPVDPENPGNQGDAITISIKADKAEFAEDEAQTFTVSIDKPVGRDVVVTLDGGQTVTIKANEQTVTYTRPAQGDDVYQDGADLSVALEGAKAADGAAFENLTLGDPATAKVVDTVDVVTATLTANTDSVAEGGEITYTITLSNEKGAPMDQHGELTFTLANGETITIKAGETTGSVTTPVADDAFVGGQPAIENSIVGAPTMAGGVAFEKLETAGTPTVAVTDEPGTPGGPVDPENPGNQGDAITISIKADKAEFAEDEAQTFTVSIDKPVGRDVVVTLDGGQTVTIKANEQTVTYTRPAQGDDVYQDGADLSVALEGAKAADGAAFENLTLGDPATAKVVDTVDVVTATLTANTDSVAEGGEITYTITLSNEKGAPMDQHGELTFTLANGETITIKAGETTGSVTTPVADDAFVGGQPAIENSIVGAPTMAGGVAFEKLETAGTPTVAVTDEPGTPGGPVDPENPGNQGDAITISIKADKAEFAEDEAQTFTVSIDKPVGRDVVVTLDGGQTVTIKANEQTVTYTRPAQGDDVYKDGADLSVALEGAKAADGAAFENLTLGDAATAKVVDTVDTVTATLKSIGQPTLGADITYQVVLTNKDNLPIDRHGKITVTLDSGKVIEIPAGESIGSITFKLTQAGALTDGIHSVVVDGDVQFENLTSTGIIDLNVTNIAPTVGEGKAVVSEEGLAGGIKDNQGTSDTTDKTLVTGKLAISDPDSSNLTVKLVAPADGNIKSGGVAVKWTVEADGTLVGKAGNVEVIKASIDHEGSYTVELKAPVDHPVKGQEDTLDFNIGVQVSDETSTVNSKIVVTVEDDSPVATNVSQTLTVPVSEVLVTGLQGGFKNWVYTSGYDSSKKQNNKDSDAYHEELRWGASGYDYYDNETLRNNTENLIGSTFKLGTFKHINQPISGGELATTDLVVKFNVTIDGAVHQIEHTIKLKHTETPNDRWNPGNAASRDIVEIDQSSLKKTFTVGDRTFEFTIDGFKNSEYGTPVSKVLTWENATNTFDLYATISAVDDMPKIEGKLEGDVYGFGADGAANDGQGVVWEGAVKQQDGSYKIVNEFGTFIGKSDGSYTFEMTREARDKMTADDLKAMTFKYSVTDKDGDGATADLVISLKGKPNNAPEQKAPEVSLTLTADSEEVTLPGGGFGGDDEVGLGSAWTVVQGPISMSDKDKHLLAVDADNVKDGAPVRVESSTPVVGVLPAHAQIEIDLGWNNGYANNQSDSGAAMQAIFYFNGVALLSVTTPKETHEGGIWNQETNWAGYFRDNVLNAEVKVLYEGVSFELNGVQYGLGQTALLETWAKTYPDTDKRNTPDYLMDKLQKIVISLSEDITSAEGEGKLAVEFHRPDRAEDSVGTADDIQIGSFKLVIPGGGGTEPGTGVQTTFKAAVVINDVDSTLLKQAVIRVDGLAEGDLLKLEGDSTFHVSKSALADVWTITTEQPHAIEDWNAFLSKLELTTLDTAGKSISVTVTDAEGNDSKPAVQDLSDVDGVAAPMSMSVFGAALLADEQVDALVGTDANDNLVGTVGNDTLIGGAGDDIMFGGEGDDTFVWNKGDEGTTIKPAVDYVMDFGDAGTDTLDITDLLSGHDLNNGDLSQYLTVSRSDSGKMEIGISSQGNGQIDQKIILDNIDFDAEKAAQIANSLKDGTLKSSDF